MVDTITPPERWCDLKQREALANLGIGAPSVPTLEAHGRQVVVVRGAADVRWRHPPSAFAPLHSVDKVCKGAVTYLVLCLLISGKTSLHALTAQKPAATSQ